MWNTETPAYKPKNKGLGGIRNHKALVTLYKIVGIV